MHAADELYTTVFKIFSIYFGQNKIYMDSAEKEKTCLRNILSVLTPL